MLQRMDCVIAAPIQLAILFMNMAVQQNMILHQRIQRGLQPDGIQRALNSLQHQYVVIAAFRIAIIFIDKTFE